MTLVLICLAVSVATFAVATILNKLGEKWSRLPHFRHNSVGGVFAVCGFTDYERAVANGSLIQREGKEPLVLVPDTITFSDDWVPASPYRSGRMLHFDVPPYPDFYLGHSEDAPQLFVPFTSERFMSFEKQAQIFKPENLPDFEQRKCRENREQNFRLRFSDWVSRGDTVLSGVRIASGLASFLLFIIAGFTWFGKSDEAYRREPATVHLTSPGSQAVQKINTTRGERSQLLMYEDFGDDSIIGGQAFEVLALGGGISQVCVQRPNEQLRCGLGNGEVKIGDTVYLRTGELLRWANKDWHPNHETGSWVITQAEAEALTSTGKFQIIE